MKNNPYTHSHALKTSVNYYKCKKEAYNEANTLMGWDFLIFLPTHATITFNPSFFVNSFTCISKLKSFLFSN